MNTGEYKTVAKKNVHALEYESEIDGNTKEYRKRQIENENTALSPVKRQPVTSFAQSTFRTDGQSKTFFKVIDHRKESIQSSPFMYRGERVKVSKRIKVFKNSSIGHNIPNEQVMDCKKAQDCEGYSEIWDDGNQMTADNEDRTEEDGPITRSTVTYEMASEQDLFNDDTRNCAWHLNVEGTQSVCKLSPNNLDAIAIEDDNILLGSKRFAFGRHTWVIQGLGFFCAVGICRPGDELGSWYKGGKWVWTTDGLKYSEPQGIRRSEFGQWKNEDVLEVTLDCEEHALTIVNTRTNVQENLNELTGEVYPYFNIYRGSSIRLLKTSMD